MESWVIVIIIFSSLFLFLIFGLPIAFTMGGLATIYTFLFWNIKGTYVLVTTALGQLTSFVLIAVPLYIFLGVTLEKTGIAEDMYDTVYKWLGVIKGGLAVGTIFICAIFAAMVGTSSAGTITMGLIALPSMLKRGYSKFLVVGSISAGGALGILIPPSIIMILYGSLTEVSVGKMFFGGLIPGIILTMIFIIYILVICKIKTNYGPSIPKGERFTFREKFVSLKNMIIPLGLVLLILGTIYTGICTPTESAAIGAFGTLICAISMKKLNWSIFYEVGTRTIHITSFVMWIMVGAVVFSQLVIATGAGETITKIVIGMNLNRWVILCIMQFIFMILGCLIDPAGIMVLCCPVFVPIIINLGFDPLWFGVLFVVNMEMAYITPPFGYNLFYMKAIVPKEITLENIYQSIIPFVGLQLIALILMMLFPEVILWLPNHMIVK